MTADERDAITWQMWRHLILMIAEIAQTPRKVHETNWKEHSHIVNQELFVRTLLSGRPLVLISGHFGNFELGGYLMGLFGFPTYTVARELDNRFLDRFVNDFRGRTGQYMLPKKGSGADIQHVLESGGILTLLGRPGRRATAVLGRTSSASRPPRTKPSRCSRSATTRRRWSATPAASASRCTTKSAPPRSATRASPASNYGTVPLLAQWYTDHLEQLVRQSPGQYWWLHRRWKGEPGVRKKTRHPKTPRSSVNPRRASLADGGTRRLGASRTRRVHVASPCLRV